MAWLRSRCAASECLSVGSLTEDALEGGALCTVDSEIDVVGLRSLHRAEIDGQRRPSRDVRLSFDCSTDLRRLALRVLNTSASSPK